MTAATPVDYAAVIDHLVAGARTDNRTNGPPEDKKPSSKPKQPSRHARPHT